MRFTIEKSEGDLVHQSEAEQLLAVKFTQKEGEPLNYQVLMFDNDTEDGAGMTMFRVLQAWEQVTRLLLSQGEAFEVDDLAADLKDAIDKNSSIVKANTK